MGTIVGEDINTEFRNAANDGNLELTKEYLNDGADINTTNKHKNTALHLSTFYGHENIVQFLVDQGADLNASNINGQTPLQLACVKHHENIVKIFTSANCELNTATKFSGMTALHFASKEGQAQICQHLLDCGAIEEIPDLVEKFAEYYAANEPTAEVFRKRRKEKEPEKSRAEESRAPSAKTRAPSAQSRAPPSRAQSRAGSARQGTPISVITIESEIPIAAPKEEEFKEEIERPLSKQGNSKVADNNTNTMEDHSNSSDVNILKIEREATKFIIDQNPDKENEAIAAINDKLDEETNDVNNDTTNTVNPSYNNGGNQQQKVVIATPAATVISSTGSDEIATGSGDTNGRGGGKTRGKDGRQYGWRHKAGGGNFRRDKNFDFEWSDDYRQRQKKTVFSRLMGGGNRAPEKEFKRNVLPPKDDAEKKRELIKRNKFIDHIRL